MAHARGGDAGAAVGLDISPAAALDVFFDEIAAAPHTEALVVGVYLHALPALAAALHRHLDETNTLMDHPSYRICRFALIEVEEMAAFGAQASGRILTTERLGSLAEWRGVLDQWLDRAGGLDGAAEPSAGEPARQFSATPRPFVREPRRDARFADPYNMGVHAEVFSYDAAMPPDAKTLMMYYKRLREIDVPEIMASIIAETPGKPWQYYVDMTRQLWDEARHAMMGEVGFVQAGIDWARFVRVNFTWSLALNTQLTPIERHAVLYFIEQGLMPRTGKRFEWEVGVASGDAYSAMAQDYDWADEVLHARIGRDWYVKEMGDSKTATDYGDRCWSRVLIDWQSYLDRGLTRHENWWPALYREWCRVHSRTPDPHVLEFHTSYAAARADLKDLSVAG